MNGMLNSMSSSGLAEAKLLEVDIWKFMQASPGRKTTRAIKSPCPFGCVGYLALAELLISFYI